jgi:hypothetical protein
VLVHVSRSPTYIHDVNPYLVVGQSL